jgi:hypothetical protein
MDGPQRVVLNIDSREIPVYGEQEHSAYSGDAGLARAVAGSDGIERRDPGQVGSGTIHSELGSGGKSGRKWRN